MSNRESRDIDVFLSYNQQDNEVSSKVEVPGWVSHFGLALEISLQRNLGTKIPGVTDHTHANGIEFNVPLTR